MKMYFNQKFIPMPTEMVSSSAIKIKARFEYTVYTMDGREVAKGFAYYNKNIDLTKVPRGTYIFTYKNEKGDLQKVKVIR